VSYEFLTVEAPETRGFRPVARSSMQRRLAEAGAEFEERDGWLVAVRLPEDEDRRIAVRDVTHAYHVIEADGHVELEFGDGDYGVRPPTGRGRTVVARPRHGAGAAGNLPEGAMDMTAAWAGIEIQGSGASRVMRRLTELDLDELPLVGLLAHVRALIARAGDEHYLVFFPQEYGHYLWEVVVDAAEPLGGGPAA
jgi:sarcosine oxidase gamma subunit